MHTCPCCGEITYMSDRPSDLCPECSDGGCVVTRAADGDVGYFDCQRTDLDLDIDDYPDYDDDSYDEYDDWRYPGPDYPEYLDMPSYSG